jgi:hypothetical protein
VSLKLEDPPQAEVRVMVKKVQRTERRYEKSAEAEAALANAHAARRPGLACDCTRDDSASRGTDA